MNSKLTTLLTSHYAPKNATQLRQQHQSTHYPNEYIKTYINDQQCNFIATLTMESKAIMEQLLPNYVLQIKNILHPHPP